MYLKDIVGRDARSAWPIDFRYREVGDRWRAKGCGARFFDTRVLDDCGDKALALTARADDGDHPKVISLPNNGKVRQMVVAVTLATTAHGREQQLPDMLLARVMFHVTARFWCATVALAALAPTLPVSCQRHQYRGC